VVGLGLKHPVGSELPDGMPESRSGLVLVRHVNHRAVVREVAVLHVGHWHRGLFVRAGAIAQTLVSAEIKKFVGDYFSAGGSPKTGLRLNGGFGPPGMPELISVKKSFASRALFRKKS